MLHWSTTVEEESRRGSRSRERARDLYGYSPYDAGERRVSGALAFGVWRESSRGGSVLLYVL